MKTTTELKIGKFLIEELKLILDEVKVTQESDQYMIYLSKSYNEKVKQLDSILERLFRFDKKKHVKLDTYYLDFRFSAEYKETIKRLEYWATVNNPEVIIKDINREIDLIHKNSSELLQCTNPSEANKIAYTIRQLYSYIKRNRIKLKKMFEYSDRKLDKQIKNIDNEITTLFEQCKAKFK